ncbi:unnamed protein product [Mytilus coruscus]|uniref:ZP domain-containing protein n=1 Tax=Mytilus coruscus TaxID=42192 RepID=A0A6J8DDU6_MYTCO|nr:unnamed protein product [Mytilus coruscus]
MKQQTLQAYYDIKPTHGDILVEPQYGNKGHPKTITDLKQTLHAQSDIKQTSHGNIIVNPLYGNKKHQQSVYFNEANYDIIKSTNGGILVYPQKGNMKHLNTMTQLKQHMLKAHSNIKQPTNGGISGKQQYGNTNKQQLVNCQESNWYIRLYIRPLKQKFQDFNARDVYLGRDSCTGYESGDYIIFSEEYNSCLTDKSTSDDAVIYTNTLVYALHDPDHRFIIRDYRFKIKVECDMSKRENGGNTIKHNHGQEDHTAAGTGHFSIHLNFYSDSNYQNLFNGFPPSYVVGDVVYVKVQTNMHDYDIKMRLSDCYTKPSEHASTIYTYYLIRNGCPVDRNTFVTSQSTHETRFHFQDFEYAGHPDSMFVHCNATFCKSIDYSAECEPQCKHSKRIGHHKSADQNLNGPIEISDDETKILFIDKRGKFFFIFFRYV